MPGMKGPALLPAQFASEKAPSDAADVSARFMGGLGYKGAKIPTGDARLLEVRTANHRFDDSAGTGTDTDPVRQTFRLDQIRAAGREAQ